MADLRTMIAIKMFSLTQAAIEGKVWNELSDQAQDHHLSNADAALEAIEREGYVIAKLEGKCNEKDVPR